MPDGCRLAIASGALAVKTVVQEVGPAQSVGDEHDGQY